MQRYRRILFATSVVGTLVIAPAAHAADCAGFTDVQDTSGFCPNVEWLKNRSITLGCTSATLYCPNDTVTRLQMSAFLNRVANALTPVYAFASHGYSADLEASPVFCAPAAYAVTGFPRTAHGHAVVTAGATGVTPSAADFTVQFVVSTDGGATYTPASPVQTSTANNNGATATGTVTTATVILPPQALSPGTSYRWGLRLSRAAGSATTNDVQGTCQMYVLVENANGVTSPLDEDE